jgi:hypothetical protein
MRSRDLAVAAIGAGVLALIVAACERRVAGPVASSHEGEVAPAPAPAPLPPPTSPGDGGAGGSSVAPADGAGGDTGVSPRHHRGAPLAVAEGGARGAIGKVKVQGSVARGDVERVLRDGVPKLKACRGAGAGGKGQVDLELLIGEQGWATLAEVKRTTLGGGGDPELCIVKALRSLRFPRPSDGKDTAVSFVLQFRQ